MKKCIYPGTFDPITNGHIDVIKRASLIFDKIILAVAKNPEKSPLFSIEQRIKMAEICVDKNKVEVIGFDILLVELAKSLKTNIIIRGLRAVSDFEFEMQMHYANASLWEDIETLYLMPNLQNAFISSSIVRSVLKHNGDISKLVPKNINEIVLKEFKKEKNVHIA